MWGNTTKYCLKRGRGEEGEENFFREKCTKSNSSAQRFVPTYMDSMIRVGGKSERGDICIYIAGSLSSAETNTVK